MEAYLILGLVINFLVSLILLMAVHTLSLRNVLRCVLASMLGSLFAAISLIPRFEFLQNGLWRTVSTLIMCATAFGISPQAVRQAAVFCLLRLALEGLDDGGAAGILWSVVLYVVYRFVFSGQKEQLVPVEICTESGTIRCSALRDTGHRLWDPITGKRVLVVDAEVAEALTGLTAMQFAKPLQTMGAIPGLRLIPYRSVGGTGLLLARQYSRVTIGDWQGESIVAFSPEVLDRKGTYQALTGGTV